MKTLVRTERSQTEIQQVSPEHKSTVLLPYQGDIRKLDKISKI
jgi:hypothetical protein